MDENTMEALRQLDERRASEMKLRTMPCTDETKEALLFKGEGKEIVMIFIPVGLDLRGQLLCMDVYLLGREHGRDEGRHRLQNELLDLIGGQRRE